MKSFDEMTDIERQNLGAGQLVDYTSTIEGKASIYEYDEKLKATVERTPEGLRYVVNLQGSQLVRIGQLS